MPTSHNIGSTGTAGGDSPIQTTSHGPNTTTNHYPPIPPQIQITQDIDDEAIPSLITTPYRDEDEYETLQSRQQNTCAPHRSSAQMTTETNETDLATTRIYERTNQPNVTIEDLPTLLDQEYDSDNDSRYSYHSSSSETTFYSAQSHQRRPSEPANPGPLNSNRPPSTFQLPNGTQRNPIMVETVDSDDESRTTDRDSRPGNNTWYDSTDSSDDSSYQPTSVTSTSQSSISTDTNDDSNEAFGHNFGTRPAQTFRVMLQNLNNLPKEEWQEKSRATITKMKKLQPDVIGCVEVGLYPPICWPKTHGTKGSRQSQAHEASMHITQLGFTTNPSFLEALEWPPLSRVPVE